MAILEVTRRRLTSGLLPTDPTLRSVLPQIRETTGASYIFYSPMEEPEVFFVIGEWPSMDAYQKTTSSADYVTNMAPLEKLSHPEWTEHMPIDTITTLPLDAPVMTVSRCFFKEHSSHPSRYITEVSQLIPLIEAETKPWRYIGAWTVDTTEESHKWIVFGPWRSKKHHQEFATKLKGKFEFFETIPEHYAEGTVHRHCWNMETTPNPEIFETLPGFVPQVITKDRP